MRCDAERMGGSGRRIAIVGAGYSGTLTAIQLLRRCRPDEMIAVPDIRWQCAELAGHLLPSRDGAYDRRVA